MNIQQDKRRALGHHCPHFGGDSSSASSTTDKRVTAGSIGISGDGNTVTDGGIVARGLDTVDLSIANLGGGYQSLIDAAGDLFDRGEGLIGQTQKAVADAYGQAQTNQAGALDNRTIVVLGVAVAVVAGIYFFNKG